jgi:tetratricopeptide (TPR) repeat protein
MRSFANGHVQQNVRQAFAVLKEKCTINKEFPNVSDYTLYSLLWALENHYQFNQFDIDWMIEKRLYPITANYYFKEYNRDHNFWNLIKSCSAWRKAGFPDIGLQVTENVISARSVEMAAILTTRGGAFKDLGVLDTAEQCARSALTYSISKYPYSLLGAIYYLNGSPEKGDEYFEKAMQLGLSSNARDRMILEAYTDASIPQKEEMMKYFQNHNQALFLSLLGF